MRTSPVIRTQEPVPRVSVIEEFHCSCVYTDLLACACLLISCIQMTIDDVLSFLSSYWLMVKSLLQRAVLLLLAKVSGRPVIGIVWLWCVVISNA